jgi:hypothetical protein
MVVFVHHSAPAQWWFSYTIANLPNNGFCTPSHTHLMAVFIHNCTPAQQWFSYTIMPLLNGNFCTPLCTRPTMVLMLQVQFYGLVLTASAAFGSNALHGTGMLH